MNLMIYFPNFKDYFKYLVQYKDCLYSFESTYGDHCKYKDKTFKLKICEQNENFVIFNLLCKTWCGKS